LCDLEEIKLSGGWLLSSGQIDGAEANCTAMRRETMRLEAGRCAESHVFEFRVALVAVV
jgi:hypothetical protein